MSDSRWHPWQRGPPPLPHFSSLPPDPVKTHRRQTIKEERQGEGGDVIHGELFPGHKVTQEEEVVVFQLFAVRLLLQTGQCHVQMSMQPLQLNDSRMRTFHLHAPPPPPFSPSLISLMVSVDVKHHVYLLTYVAHMRGLNPSLPQPIKCPGWKMHGATCKQYNIQSYVIPTFNANRFDENPFTCQCEKQHKKA